MRVLAEFLHMRGTFSLTGSRAVAYTAESSMAYRVLRGLKHPFFRSASGTIVGNAHEAPRRGTTRDGTWDLRAGNLNPASHTTKMSLLPMYMTPIPGRTRLDHLEKKSMALSICHPEKLHPDNNKKTVLCH